MKPEPGLACPGRGDTAGSLELLPLREAAWRLGLAPVSLYAPRWKRRLGAIKVGRALRFPVEGLEEFRRGRRAGEVGRRMPRFLLRKARGGEVITWEDVVEWREAPYRVPRRPGFLTVEELADRWRLSRGTIYLKIRARDIPAVRIGRRVLIPEAVAARFEEAGDERL